MRIAVAILVFCISLQLSAGTRDAELKELLQKSIDRGYPGIAMILQMRDGITHSAVVGFSDLQKRIPLRIDDGFHMASINKTITATAVLQLIDEKKISQDSKIADILGAAVARIPYSDQITVAQLLDHSSGIYPTNNDMDYLNTVIGPNADPHRVWTPRQFLALADQDRSRPAGKPGDGHHYSDTNYILLGMIVEKVSGQSFKTYIKQSLLEPLGMRSTYFYSDYLSDNATPPVQTVRGYLLATKDLRDVISIHPMFSSVEKRKEGELLDTTAAAERIDAAAGLVTNLPDLLKFAEALFRGKLLSQGSQHFLLSAAQDMDQQKIGEERIWTLQSVRKPYGVLVYKEGDGPGGVNTLMAFHPASGDIFVSFTNIFGYFNENDFIMDDIIGKLEPASPRE